MFDDMTYIILEGLLSEAGEFQFERGYEATHAATDIRFGSNDRNLKIALMNKAGQVLTSTTPDIAFPSGCTPDQTRPGIGLVRAAIPLSKTATQIVITSGERTVYEHSIAASHPTLEVLEFNQEDATVRITIETGNEQPDIRILAALKQERQLQPSFDMSDGEITIDLKSLAGFGSCEFIVEATSNFRTTRYTSQCVKLPEATVNAWILEPAPDTEWAFGWRGSFIGSLFDNNGRQLNWNEQEMRWIVNGEPLEDTRQLIAWQPESAGEYLIELASVTANGKHRTLDEICVTVLPQTQEQKKYMELIAAYKASKNR